jgi:hypothetical protein
MRMNRKEWLVLFIATTCAFLMHPALFAQSPQWRTGPAGVKLVSFGQPVAPAAQASSPKLSFVLKDRHGHATPMRTHAAHTGGGNVDVAQPRDDTLIITMTGVVTAGPHPGVATAASLAFDLDQDLEIVSADPKIKMAKLTLEAQIVGLLRGDEHGGCAGVNNGSLVVVNGKTTVLSLAIEGHTVSGGENLAINDRKGPVSVAVPPGDYHLLQTFHISANHAHGIRGKAAAAEFAPDPTLDPTWISVTDPFRGANKKEFGFRVILRVEPE